jgi:hypothetical protein
MCGEFPYIWKLDPYNIQTHPSPAHQTHPKPIPAHPDRPIRSECSASTSSAMTSVAMGPPSTLSDLLEDHKQIHPALPHNPPGLTPTTAIRAITAIPGITNQSQPADPPPRRTNADHQGTRPPRHKSEPSPMARPTRPRTGATESQILCYQILILARVPPRKATDTCMEAGQRQQRLCKNARTPTRV